MKSPRTHKRTSDLLKDIIHLAGRNDITAGDFVSLLKDRSFPLAMLVFSLPNSLPMPGIPGLSTVTGLPILCISMQIIGGRKTIWLPKRVAAKHFKAEFLTKIISKALPMVLWMERFLHPRLSVICRSAGERFIGLLIAIMAFILALPIAGANFLPGVSISLLALALLEEDGLFAVFSILFSIASFALLYEIIRTVAGGVMHWASVL